MTDIQKVLHHGQVLWDYHLMKSDVEPSDFILALGSHDLRTANRAGELFNDGLAKLIVCSGGFGKVTKEKWHVTEAEKFKEVISGMGVDESSILIEPEATNTGDNFLFTKALLEKRGMGVRSGIIVTKPYMCRRAFATGSRQWPSVHWQATAPDVSFWDYPNTEVPLDKTLNLMVGDLQRIAIYPSQGFQIPQEIPKDVWESYHFLVSKGFDKFVIKDT